MCVVWGFRDKGTPVDSLFFSCFVAYADLMSRKEARESSWEQPGWDEVVRRTGRSKGILLQFYFIISFFLSSLFCSSFNTVYGVQNSCS